MGLKEHKCPRCGAPLTMQAGAEHVTCQYCGANIAVQNKPKPKGPPPPPTPSGEVVLYTGSSARGWIVFSAAISILATAGIGLGVAATATKAGSPASVLADVGIGTTTLPARCGTNGKLLVKGQTVDLKGVAIQAATNCQIRIVDSTVTADKLVEWDGPNVKVTLENTQVVVRKVALEGHAPNPGLTMLAGSSIQGPTAVKCGLNLDLKLEGSKISASDDAVRSDGSADVQLTNAHITSDKTSLDIGHSAKVRLSEGSTIVGRIAIKSDHDTELYLDKGTVRGTKTALEVRAVKLEATGKDSRVEAPVAIDAQHTATVRLEDGAHIMATKTAIKAGHQAAIELSNSRIESDGDAVEADHTVLVELEDGSLIKAKRNAVVAGHSAEIELLRSEIIGGKIGVKAMFKRKLEVDSESKIVGAKAFTHSR